MPSDTHASEFDEEWYLRTYPDVAGAVRAGTIRSGRQHFLDFGKAEGRKPHRGYKADDRPPIATVRALDWPAIDVELTASEDELQSMRDRVKCNFEFMGEWEPHWSVLSAERYLRENIAGTEDEFFASGKDPVLELTAAADRSGVRLDYNFTCFELGCGLGRSTIWLADCCKHVIAADISAPHLRIAAGIAKRFGKTNVAFMQIDHPALIETLPPFDIFFSIIVLQHNPPPVIMEYLKEILYKLNPGGLAYFRVPTYRHKYNFRTAQYLGAPITFGMPEMHVVPQPYLYELFEHAGCHPIEIREDNIAGTDHLSNRFFVRKKNG